jgi:hypothetical protein
MTTRTRKPASIPARNDSPLQKKKKDGEEKQASLTQKAPSRNNSEEQKNKSAVAASVENFLYQRKAIDDEEITQPFKPIQKKENQTGLPDNLKSGIESLSGFSMDDVKVHYNSAKPAQLSALAYAQGTDIHVAAGQEKHLPHEAWHVVQQKQGRVKATMQMKGISVNDDKELEKEADVMGGKAFQLKSNNDTQKPAPQTDHAPGETVQMLKNLSPGTYVEVRSEGSPWYGYIDTVQGANYEIILGGTTAKGYGTKDKDAVKKAVPAEQVYLHPSIKAGLGIGLKDDRELTQMEVALLKGRGYKKLTKASVEQGWKNISDKERSAWDKTFAENYKPNLELEKQDVFSKDLNKMLRDQITVEVVWNTHRETLSHYDINSQIKLAEWKSLQPIPVNDDKIYDKEESFKLGWKGSAITNAHRRSAKEKHGEYTGSYNLQQGWFKAEGSYRSGDDLQQNEIIYQIWKAVHEKEGLDMNRPEQRKPLRKIIRNHVVNEESQPIIGPLKDGTYDEGTKQFDTLLAAPNIRAVLFLIKDRGKELGISGISRISLPGVDAHIFLR